MQNTTAFENAIALDSEAPRIASGSTTISISVLDTKLRNAATEFLDGFLLGERR
jgi:hypothetical protein